MENANEFIILSVKVNIDWVSKENLHSLLYKNGGKDQLKIAEINLCVH